jgi:hypothetical protein
LRLTIWQASTGGFLSDERSSLDASVSGSSREALGVQHHAAFGPVIVSRSTSQKTSYITTKLKIDVSAA